MDIIALLQSKTVIGGIHAAAALLGFMATWEIGGLIKVNKGAAANTSWTTMAAGLIFVSMGESSRFLEMFGFPNLSEWASLLTAAGILFMFVSAIMWRRLIKKLIK